jgi:hypothetical protein
MELKSNYSIITLIYHLGLYNRPEVAAVPGDISPTPLIIIIIITIITIIIERRVGEKYAVEIRETPRNHSEPKMTASEGQQEFTQLTDMGCPVMEVCSF